VRAPRGAGRLRPGAAVALALVVLGLVAFGVTGWQGLRALVG
jgi:hypothetical protein